MFEPINELLTQLKAILAQGAKNTCQRGVLAYEVMRLCYLLTVKPKQLFEEAMRRYGNAKPELVLEYSRAIDPLAHNLLNHCREAVTNWDLGIAIKAELFALDAFKLAQAFISLAQSSEVGHVEVGSY